VSERKVEVFSRLGRVPPAVGAAFLLITQTFLPDLQHLAQNLLPGATLLHNMLERWLLLFGILFILVVIFFPKGVIGSVQDYVFRRKKIIPE
jgi:branched-chain amino acid transport system permease protein